MLLPRARSQVLYAQKILAPEPGDVIAFDLNFNQIKGQVEFAWDWMSTVMLAFAARIDYKQVWLVLYEVFQCDNIAGPS